MMSANYWSAIFYAPMYLLGGYVALHFGMQFEGYISENIGRPFDIETHNTNNVERNRKCDKERTILRCYNFKGKVMC